MILSLMRFWWGVQLNTKHVQILGHAPIYAHPSIARSGRKNMFNHLNLLIPLFPAATVAHGQMFFVFFVISLIRKLEHGGDRQIGCPGTFLEAFFPEGFVPQPSRADAHLHTPRRARARIHSMCPRTPRPSRPPRIEARHHRPKSTLSHLVAFCSARPTTAIMSQAPAARRRRQLQAGADRVSPLPWFPAPRPRECRCRFAYIYCMYDYLYLAQTYFSIAMIF